MHLSYPLRTLLLFLLSSSTLVSAVNFNYHDAGGQAPIPGQSVERQSFEGQLSHVRAEIASAWDGESHSEPSWDYTGITGPLAWANIDPGHFTDCSTASSQSPINLDNSMKPNYFNYKWSAPKSYCLNMTNDGHGITLLPCNPQPYNFATMGTGNKVVGMKNKDEDEEWFSLSHISLHSPSEHRFLGEYFPLEAQFVMKNQYTGRYRIRSVLFDIVFPGKKASSFFDGIYPHLPSVAKKGSYTLARDVNTVDLMRVFQKGGLAGQVYNYKGSLTTPPCTPGVEWDVFSDPMYITVETYLVVKAIVGFNSRYTQNKPGRENLLQVACHLADN